MLMTSIQVEQPQTVMLYRMQEREVVIRELIASPQLGRLLQDAYANYVMQSALMVTQVRHLKISPSLCSIPLDSCSTPLLQLVAAAVYTCCHKRFAKKILHKRCRKRTPAIS